MPFAGLGLHLAIALFFAVHAVRTRQELYWLLILFSFPLLGSAVYFFAVYLPSSRLERGVSRAAHHLAERALHVLDPERELREAGEAYDLSPSAQNRWRLADALLALGRGSEAIGHFDALLAGPLGHDPELRLATARARLACGQAGGAAQLVTALRTQRPEFRPEETALLEAEALSAAGRTAEALSAYSAAEARFGTFEIRAGFALFAAAQGQMEQARALRAQIERDSRHWNAHVRKANGPLLHQVDSALAPAHT